MTNSLSAKEWKDRQGRAGHVRSDSAAVTSVCREKDSITFRLPHTHAQNDFFFFGLVYFWMTINKSLMYYYCHSQDIKTFRCWLLKMKTEEWQRRRRRRGLKRSSQRCHEWWRWTDCLRTCINLNTSCAGCVMLSKDQHKPRRGTDTTTVQLPMASWPDTNCQMYTR